MTSESEIYVLIHPTKNFPPINVPYKTEVEMWPWSTPFEQVVVKALFTV